jgi:outer membrane lipoprotein-sorting protein
MKKRNIFILTLLLITLTIHAQQSAEAKALLDKTYALFEATKGIRLSFRAASLDTGGNEQGTMEGTAIIRGDRFRLETGDLDIWFDGTTQWVLMKEVNEVNISHPTGEEIESVSPLALLRIYRNGYTLMPPFNVTVNGKKAQLIRMTPTAANKEYKMVEAVVDHNNYRLVEVKLTLQNGSKQVVTISDYNANYNYSDTEFQFDQSRHPDALIVDLR